MSRLRQLCNLPFAHSLGQAHFFCSYSFPFGILISEFIPWALMSFSWEKAAYSEANFLYCSFFSPSSWTAFSISFWNSLMVSVEERADFSASKLWFRIKHLCDGIPSGSCWLGGFPSKVLNRLVAVFFILNFFLIFSGVNLAAHLKLRNFRQEIWKVFCGR